MKKIIWPLAIIFLLGVSLWWAIGPGSLKSNPGRLIISENEPLDPLTKLKQEHYLRHELPAQILYLLFFGDKKIEPGGYRLDTNMNAWQILSKVTGKPDLVWVTVREGLRKEQIGILLTEALGWTSDEENQWNNLYTLDNKPEYAEGVYFPDTYLIPRDETVAQVAQRFLNNFNEKFAPYLTKFTEQNIRWTTGLKIASLIQREAGGPADMPIISGVIWNRLEQGMKLEIDVTLQYVRGVVNGNWWGPIDLATKQIDSPYNDYLYAGLPPTPIANPGLAAIDAALNPAQTDCLYYLHDPDRQIHCAKTYAEHLQNIKKYLSN